ncbi:protein of unknown function [Nitratireductor aquimarinus]
MGSNPTPSANPTCILPNSVVCREPP